MSSQRGIVVKEVNLRKGWLLRDVNAAALTVETERWRQAQLKCNKTYAAWQEAVAEYEVATALLKETRNRAIGQSPK